MNAQTNVPPALSTMLAQVATVVSISTTSLGLMRQDKQSSRQLDMQKNATQGTGKVSASRLAGAEEQVKAINAKVAEIQSALKSMTTAYQDRRLLANTMMQDWLGVFAPMKADYDRMVGELQADAHRLVAEAEHNKGSYNISTATVEEIQSSFSLEFDMQPVPDASTWRATGVNQQLEAEMRRHFEASVAAAYTQATNDALTRVAKPLQHLIERVAAYEEREKDKARGVAKPNGGKFYDSVVTNIQDVAAVFRSFNLTNDPIMNDIADRLDAFHGFDANDLKHDDKLRKDVTKKAAAILEDLKDLI